MQKAAWKSVQVDATDRGASSFDSRLTPRQLERLRACASGISLRFDSPEDVAALIAGGYAEQNVAGVVAVTAKGHAYLRSRAD